MYQSYIDLVSNVQTTYIHILSKNNFSWKTIQNPQRMKNCSSFYGGWDYILTDREASSFIGNFHALVSRVLAICGKNADEDRHEKERQTYVKRWTKIMCVWLSALVSGRTINVFSLNSRPQKLRCIQYYFKGDVIWTTNFPRTLTSYTIAARTNYHCYVHTFLRNSYS